MKLYEIRLSVPSGFLTPWHADTIWGHLCWCAERQGEFQNFTGAGGFINLYRAGTPPLVLSDGFPAGYLPAPANLRELFDRQGTERLDVDRYSLLKKIKGMRYLTLEQFRSYQNGKVFDAAGGNKDNAGLVVTTVTLHNQISRTTGLTGDSGSLFELDEQFLRDGELSLYARIADGFEDDIRKLFELFAATGFGKKKSSGKGSFSIKRFERFSGFEQPDNANGFITLSHFVPAASDPVEGAYKTVVKYGRMGEEKSFGGNPFKKPLVMLKPGAVFCTQENRPWYGRLIEQIAYADESVVQYGYAFAVPVSI